MRYGQRLRHAFPVAIPKRALGKTGINVGILGSAVKGILRTSRYEKEV